MNPISVLYADDDPALLDVATIFLEQTGAFKVTTVSSAIHALEDLKIHTYDAIISDYEMPGMDGIEFLKIFRTRYEDIPFILFTGRGREEVVVDAFDSGADSYIQKGGNPKTQFLELQQKIKINVERRQAQKALLDSERKYRELFENAQEAVYIIQDEKFAFFNPRFSRIIKHYGLSMESILTQPFYTFIHPEDQEVVRERFYKRTEHDEKFPGYTIRIINTSGDCFWWEVEAIKTEWEGRSATLNFARDVTEQHLLKEEADESEGRYKEMVESLPKTVFEMTENLALTYINNAGTKKFGYRNDELNGTITALDLVIPEERQKIRDQYDRIQNGEPLLGHETTAITKFNTTFPMMVYFFPVKKKNKVNGFRTICIDISRYKMAKRDLLVANKRLNMMCKITRHDIQDKLTALVEYLELAQNKSADTDVTKYVQKSRTMADLIQEQINFTKTCQDFGLFVPEWQNLKEVIDALNLQVSEEIVQLDTSIRDLEIYADFLLREVFFNLFEYSLRRGEQVTAVTISCSNQGNNLVVVYEDNGIGIPVNDTSHLFTHNNERHSGHLLFLTREILSITGISISETGIPGKGARFELIVPAGKYRFITESLENITSTSLS